MWKNLTLNANAIQASTDKAVLIKIPKKELSFWHPAKLVRKRGYQISVGYTDAFKFEGKRTSKTTFKVLGTQTFSAKEMEEICNV